MKRHRTDVVSLLFGLLFIALAAWWAVAYYLDWTLDWNVPNFGWFAAGVLILVGLFWRGGKPASGPARAGAGGAWNLSTCSRRRTRVDHGGDGQRRPGSAGHRFPHGRSRAGRVDADGRTPGRARLGTDIAGSRPHTRAGRDCHPGRRLC
jgi:hypothetical protein